jgi:mRNA interferase RelE/StbE
MWKVEYTKTFEKSLSKIDSRYISRILDFAVALEKSPFPESFDILKMEGYENKFRCRVGIYRILYEVNKKEINIILIDVAHRKDVYR